ncbi:hypothetical protein AVEN_135186-1 [Araneus ventricosus]|uniref:Uncharacterized protein n=1 Tax=Araneus ventricosus TaxID=182803 RepID=A0A4Y2JVS1_ARAVE|nr:hypothetical protein AVEN_135186-1 [Araneus ventricosus]
MASVQKLLGQAKTAGSFSPSSDSLADAWAPTVYKRCHNQVFVDYLIHGFFTYRHFNSNFTCGKSSSTAEIVALLVTTCTYTGRGKSLMFTRPAS